MEQEVQEVQVVKQRDVHWSVSLFSFLLIVSSIIGVFLFAIGAFTNGLEKTFEKFEDFVLFNFGD